MGKQEPAITTGEPGFGWDHENKVGRIIAAAALFATTFALLPAANTGTYAMAMSEARAATTAIEVIAQESIERDDTAENLLGELGGAVTDHLGTIGSFAANIPTAATATPHSSAKLTASRIRPYDDDGSLLYAATTIGADDLWNRNITGSGCGRCAH